MSIKVKLGEIVNAVESKSLGELAQLKGLSAKSAYDVAKLVKRLGTEQDAYNAARDMLIKNLGEDDGKGRVAIKQDSPNMATFVKEMNGLLDREVELKISKVVLPKPKGDEPCGLTAANLMLLESFIEIPGVTDAAEEAKDGDAKPEKGTDA